MKTFIRIWNSWDPQNTWQEAVRLTIIESALALAFIAIFSPLASR